MIRGAIEVVQKARVAGWLYSANEPLRDKTVLAFVGTRCIGSGKVERFRQDLLDAKLGDGYCGFDFPIRLVDGEAGGAVIVRLQFSDMALIQTSSQISGIDDAPVKSSIDLGAIPPSGVSWMMDHGMLDQPEYDFLKAIQSTGAYERGLRVSKRGTDHNATETGRLDPETVVREMLGLFTLSEPRITRTTQTAVSDLTANTALLHRAGAPVLALWSKDRGRIVLEERSHLTGHAADGPVAEPQAGSIEYTFGPDRLLFIHRDCRFAARGTAPASGITIFSVSGAEALATAPRKQVRAA